MVPDIHNPRRPHRALWMPAGWGQCSQDKNNCPRKSCHFFYFINAVQVIHFVVWNIWWSLHAPSHGITHHYRGYLYILYVHVSWSCSKVCKHWSWLSSKVIVLIPGVATLCCCSCWPINKNHNPQNLWSLQSEAWNSILVWFWFTVQWLQLKWRIFLPGFESFVCMAVCVHCQYFNSNNICVSAAQLQSQIFMSLRYSYRNLILNQTVLKAEPLRSDHL